MIFLDKLMLLLRNRGVTQNRFLTELNLNRNSIQNWRKQNSKPRSETMARIAAYFNVSVESLSDDFEELQYEVSTSKSTAVRLLSYYQRAASICECKYNITDEILFRLTKLVNANILFLTDISQKKYNPDIHGVGDRGEIDAELLYDVITLTDQCADSGVIRNFLIQLSRIIVYRVDTIGRHNLYNCDLLLKEKLDFIFGNDNVSAGMRFGFNITELMAIWRFTGFNLTYLITGKQENFPGGEL